MLDTQYRMPAQIADTLSKAFYDGKYLSFSGKKNLNGVLRFLSDSPYIVIDTSDAGVIRSEIKMPENMGRGYINELEADIVAKVVKLMYEKQLNMDELGVISAYKKQVELIAKKLEPILGKRAVTVAATLDSFQGQERDVILYSFTRSSKKPANCQRIGFLNELRRLNVAMSRPKKTLVLIGDMKFLSECQYIEPVSDDEDSDEQSRYNSSEKRFGEFIQLMLSDVEKYGCRLSYHQFCERTDFEGMR